MVALIGVVPTPPKDGCMSFVAAPLRRQWWCRIQRLHTLVREVSGCSVSWRAKEQLTAAYGSAQGRGLGVWRLVVRVVPDDDDTAVCSGGRHRGMGRWGSDEVPADVGGRRAWWCVEVGPEVRLEEACGYADEKDR